MKFEVAITEMYQRIPWELDADHLGSAEHILGTAARSIKRVVFEIKHWIFLVVLEVIVKDWFVNRYGDETNKYI